MPYCDKLVIFFFFCMEQSLKFLSVVLSVLYKVYLKHRLYVLRKGLVWFYAYISGWRRSTFNY